MPVVRGLRWFGLMTEEKQSVSDSERLLQRIRQLNEIGIALSAEREPDGLIERILKAAMLLTGADGGTVYSIVDDALDFDIVINESLGIHWGGTTRVSVPLPRIRLTDDQGQPVNATIAGACFHQGTTINLKDVYEQSGFDIEGTRIFDRRNNYQTASIITVPMRDHESRIIAVLQLINAMHDGTVIAFDTENQLLVESLASQASVALSNVRLNKSHRRLFESLIELVAQAIDDKSPHTAHHCRRVPELTMMLAKAAEKQREGPLADFSMTEAEEYELQVASWLHDCGKIAIPEWIVDKATKLETRFDRVEYIDAKFEILNRDAQIRLLQARLSRLMDDADAPANPEARFEREASNLKQWRSTVRHCNIGVERMREEDRDELSAMANTSWVDLDGNKRTLLSKDELKNLLIPRGTLTSEERDLCNEHINVTIRMLESLTYPAELARVPEIAGAHHERIDGSGFPRGLTGEEMTVQARAMAIADVFESLTADDRPYKKAMPLSEALNILGNMTESGHIDPDLFELFISDGIYRKYAEEFLDPSRVDTVDIENLPGLTRSTSA